MLAADPRVSAVLDADALAACFDEAYLLRNVPTVIARLKRLSRRAALARSGDDQPGPSSGGRSSPKEAAAAKR